MGEVVINKADLVHNINEIKSRVEDSKYTIIAVVKGNGYGLDIVKYTKFLESNGISFFAIASVEEALKLRREGITKPIINLTPYIDDTAVKSMINNDITITIDSKASAEIANKIAKAKNIKINAHVKIDTGLSRYGFNYKNYDEIISCINNSKNIIFQGIFSHFSNSLAGDASFSKTQFERFTKVIEKVEETGIEFKYKHICNSSGFFKYPDMRLNTARIGSAFTGIAYGGGNFLKQIGEYRTQIGKIREVYPGDIVGYGNSYVVRKQTRIAILHTGYYDGIGKTLVNQRFKILSKAKRAFNEIKNIFKDDAMYLKINNKRYKVIGQIGMFDTVIDIGNDDFNEGDYVSFPVRPIMIDSSINRKYM